MNRFKNHMIAVAALSVLAIIGTIMNSRQAAAQGPPNGLAVRIVNPAPVPVSGTVTVGNLGASTLPVAVTNFPPTQSVAVTNFPATQNVSGTVNIGTLPSGQTIVLNAPGSVPFSQSLTSSSPQFAVPTTIASQTVSSVVVTEVSGSCTGIGSFNLGLQDIVGGSAATTFNFPVGTLQAGAFPLLAQETHIFIAAGHSVGINDNTPPHGCRMDLSGYYVTQ
jgi:hypothetical protein